MLQGYHILPVAHEPVFFDIWYKYISDVIYLLLVAQHAMMALEYETTAAVASRVARLRANFT